MFDVLAYLFEQFRDPDAFGDRGVLMRHLEAAGFEDEEINDALDWLDDICGQEAPHSELLNESRALRVYASEEQDHLPSEVRGLLQFLEDQGGLSPSQRELVIERLLALPAEDVDIDSAKLVALMVLWAQQAELPVLLGEALLEAVHGEPTLQ